MDMIFDIATDQIKTAIAASAELISSDCSIYRLHNELLRRSEHNLIKLATVNHYFNHNTLAQRLFSVLDRHSSQSVDVGEMCIALSAFCRMRTSDIVRFGFYLLSDVNSGALSNRSMWIYLRSLLQALRVLFDIPCNNRLVDKWAVDVVATFHAQTNCKNVNQEPLFMSWIQDSNSSKPTWIDLLDYRMKFEDIGDSHSSSLCCLSNICPYQVAAEILLWCDDYNGNIGFSSFCRYLRNADIDDRQFHLFSELFRQLGTEYVSYFSLCCALSVFCRGSKSSKLDFAFHFLKCDLDDHLSRTQVYDMLFSYLTALRAVALHKYVTNSFLDNLSEDNCLSEAYDTMQRAFLSESVSKEVVSFDEFGLWYNSGGYEIAPWLEMINLSKWFVATNNGDRAPKVAKIVVMNDELDNESLEVAFTVPLFSQTMPRIVLGVPRSDDLFIRVNNVFAAFAEASLEDVADLLHFSNGGLLNESKIREYCCSAFADRCAADIIFRYAWRFAVCEYCMMHDSLRGTVVAVDAVEFVVACSVFVDGCKSDKLAFAFDLIDNKKLGILNRRQLWKLFRSLLLAVIALCEDFSENTELYQQIGGHLNSTAMWLMQSVFEYISSETDCGVKFSNIADWYSNEGFKFCSWLELLDNRKWRFISSTYSAY